MKFKNLLFLVLVAGLVTPAAYAQNAGFAVGIQRPIINPPVARMTHPPVQGRFPNFGVTPHIVPPIISTFPSPQFPSQVPVNRFPNVPTFVGPHRGGKDGQGFGNPGFGSPGFGNSGYGNPGYGPGSGAYGGYNNGNSYGGAYGSMYGGVYGPTIVVPENGT